MNDVGTKQYNSLIPIYLDFHKQNNLLRRKQFDLGNSSAVQKLIVSSDPEIGDVHISFYFTLVDVFEKLATNINTHYMSFLKQIFLPTTKQVSIPCTKF